MAGTLVDTITLRCLGNVDGPRFLRGLVREDHSVRLVSLSEGHSDDTHWERGQSASREFWELQCLGGQPPGVTHTALFLGGGRSGSVLITPASQGPEGKPQIWHAREVPGLPVAFTLESVALRDAGVAARFLDGRTQSGEVGLAPNTDPPFTGTHWEISRVKNTGPFFTGGE